MAHPDSSIGADNISLDETHGEVLSAGDVSPMEETAPSLPQPPLGTPHGEISEKRTAAMSSHESLKDSATHHDFPFPTLSKESQAGLGRQYRASKQLQSLFLWGFLRWLTTCGLLGLLGITIWKFNKYDVISNDQRLWFNAILTGLSIAIGLAIASSLNAMTFNIRWWLLSLQKRPLRQVDAIIKSDIMNIESYILDPWIACFALFWLLINIASQVAIACFSLVVSIDSTSTAVFLYPGTVSVADMSHFYSVLGSTAVPSYAGEEFTANIYGNYANSTLYQDSIKNIPSPGDTYDPDFIDVFYGENYWQYDFLEAPPTTNIYWSISSSSSQVYTNRTINATYSCVSYTVEPASGIGSSSTIDVFLNGNAAPAAKVTVPSVAPNETTFYLGNGTCGPRCGFINVFQASNFSPQFYQCNITISEVANAWLPEHLVNDTFAQLAARSIALGVSSDNGLYQRYPEDSGYGALFNNDPDGIGMQMAYFSIGALAVAYLSNPTVNVLGMEPEPGFAMNIHNNRKLVFIFALISGVQFLLFLITTWVATNVIVVDDSPIAISRLLQPIMARLGYGGTILGGREIAEALKKEDKEVLKSEEMKVIYTAKRYDAEGIRARVTLSDGTREGMFKSGHYD